MRYLLLCVYVGLSNSRLVRSSESDSVSTSFKFKAIPQVSLIIENECSHKYVDPKIAILLMPILLLFENSLLLTLSHLDLGFQHF